MINRNSNLMSGFIGTIIGAAIGAVITLIVSFSPLFINFWVDNDAALLELRNVKTITETTVNNDIPQYRLLDNIDVNWKTVLLDVNDKDLNNLYFKLVALDTLYDRIHQTADIKIRNEYVKQYNDGIALLIEERLVDQAIEKITQHNN